ncbi:hypothetical protein ACJMK2_014133 [Sinanodonta woodiana]|uniref:Secreted protein n=1 Tax=Sinanodonta woodiana TaxID=1069815 RepID=A0ABD3UZP9_SINWO
MKTTHDLCSFVCGLFVLQTVSSAPEVSPLPVECYNPPGDSCHWYHECLEVVYPCQESVDDYGVRYAEKYCTLFTKNSPFFSNKGKEWINATRKCLQAALVPLFRQHMTLTCKEIKTIAFESHAECYVRPSPTVSFCDIVQDWLTIFWTTKQAFVDSTLSSLKLLNEVMRRCTQRLIG